MTSKIALRPSAGVVFAHRHYRFAPVVTMRVGADRWRTNAEKIGAGIGVAGAAISSGVKLRLSVTHLAQVSAD